MLKSCDILAHRLVELHYPRAQGIRRLAWVGIGRCQQDETGRNESMSACVSTAGAIAQWPDHSRSECETEQAHDQKRQAEASVSSCSHWCLLRERMASWKLPVPDAIASTSNQWRLFPPVRGVMALGCDLYGAKVVLGNAIAVAVERPRRAALIARW